MSEPAFRFLLQNDKQPFCPSRCYIVADPKVDDRRQWTLQLDPPADAAWVYQLDDIKDWMLHGEKAVRQIIHDPKNPRTPFRDLERDDVFREYLRKVLDRIPSEYMNRRKYALMPSIADEKTRTRYKDAVEAAIPGITVLPEPEMVAEYFRLLTRTLKLETGTNNVLLVVDVGASTANMTLVLSRRDGTILDIDAKGAQRDLRVRALRGDSVSHAGRWIDLRLAEILGVADPLMKEHRDRVLRVIEQAKVRSSQTDMAVPVELPSAGKPLVIERKTLEAVSYELWQTLRPLFEKLCERLYENQTSSEDAKRKSEPRLRERRVSGPRDAHRLIDTVLLAGGTSLLPGFQEAMMATLFPDSPELVVRHVGSSFAIAAAAGGLAHILHNYDPSRLREPDGKGGDVFKAPLESTLPYPPVGFAVPVPYERPPFIARPSSGRVGWHEEEIAWLQAADDDVRQPNLGDDLLLAEYTRYVRRDIRCKFELERLRIPSAEPVEGADLDEWMYSLPWSVWFDDSVPRDDKPSLVFVRRLELRSGPDIPNYFLVLCPHWLRRLGWHARPNTRFVYVDSKGSVVATIAWWRDGGPRDVQDDVFWGEGVMVVVAPEGRKQLEAVVGVLPSAAVARRLVQPQDRNEKREERLIRSPQRVDDND